MSALDVYKKILNPKTEYKSQRKFEVSTELREFKKSLAFCEFRNENSKSRLRFLSFLR